MELWFVWVRPVCVKYPTGRQDCSHEIPAKPPARPANFFEPFLGILHFDKLFLFNHLVSHVCSLIWHFEKFRASLWSPRHSEKDDWPSLTGLFRKPFFSQFSGYAFFTWHTKLMTSLIINIPLKSNRFHRKGSTNHTLFPILPAAIISLCALSDQVQLLDCYSKPHPGSSESVCESAHFNCFL